MGKFVIKQGKSGYVFNLKAANGQVIAASRIFESEHSCKSGIESVMKNVPIANLEDQTVEGYEEQRTPKFEVYTDKAGEIRFRLKSRNGEIIVTGEGYKAKTSCLKGIESIRKNIVNAEIISEVE